MTAAVAKHVYRICISSIVNGDVDAARGPPLLGFGVRPAHAPVSRANGLPVAVVSVMAKMSIQRVARSASHGMCMLLFFNYVWLGCVVHFATLAPIVMSGDSSKRDENDNFNHG